MTTTSAKQSDTMQDMLGSLSGTGGCSCCAVSRRW